MYCHTKKFRLYVFFPRRFEWLPANLTFILVCFKVFDHMTIYIKVMWKITRSHDNNPNLPGRWIHDCKQLLSWFSQFVFLLKVIHLLTVPMKISEGIGCLKSVPEAMTELWNVTVLVSVFFIVWGWLYSMWPKVSPHLGTCKKNPYIINQNHIFSKNYCEVISG